MDFKQMTLEVTPPLAPTQRSDLNEGRPRVGCCHSGHPFFDR